MIAAASLMASLAPQAVEDLDEDKRHDAADGGHNGERRMTCGVPTICLAILEFSGAKRTAPTSEKT